MSDFTLEYYGWSPIWANTVWTNIFHIYVFLFMITGLFLVWRFMKKTKNPTKAKQANIIFSTSIIPFVLGMATDIVLPRLRISVYPDVGSSVILIWAFGVVYAMVKYEFLAITPATAANKILSTMNDCVILLNSEGEIVTINKAASEMLEYRQDELKGRSFAVILPQNATLTNLIDRIVRGEVFKNYDLIFRPKEMHGIPVSLSTSTLEDKTGSIIGIVCTAKDMSEYRKKEEELHRSNQELQQFAYVASHDLQEPLRMVASYMQLLQRRNSDSLSSDSKEYIGFAVDGAKRMQILIKDLLSYSRVGTKEKVFQPAEFRSIYEKATKNLEIAIAEYQANVTCDDLPQVIGDEGQLVQLLQNLIANALKFSKGRTPKIHVSAEQDNKNKMWIFSINDNGIGIASEYQERIFQIFQRLHTREEYKGTGIGLAVCKKIVERHGGAIWVSSTLGKGSTFWFTIPMSRNNERQVLVS